jgi:hypothetical protein
VSERGIASSVYKPRMARLELATLARTGDKTALPTLCPVCDFVSIRNEIV